MYVYFLKSCLHGKRILRMNTHAADYTWNGYVCFNEYVRFKKKVVSTLSNRATTS